MAKNTRRKRRQAVRDAEVVPAMLWLGFGVLLGLGLAVYLLIAGVLPGRISTAAHSDAPRANVAKDDEIAAESVSPEQADEDRYEFYHVLPELEVVVPDAEIQERVRTAEDDATQAEAYMLQAGSFRDSADAESRKAELAFMGLVAEIKTVNIDGELWHRVWVGPYDSARSVDAALRKLRDNDIQAIATRLPEG